MYNQPLYSGSPYMANGYQNQMAQRYQTPFQPQELIRVTGVDGAKAYQMPPNSVVPLFDNDNDIMYIKSTDGAGFPTIKSFRFIPYETTQPRPNTEYVTREEFEKLKEMIENGKQLISKTASIQQSDADDSGV